MSTPLCEYRLLTFLVILFGLVSCSQENRECTILRNVESYIEEKPDSALYVLEHIPQQSLQLPNVRALYALQYTRAQDLAEMNPSSDTLILQAVHHYRYFGSATQRFLSWFYLGRVYQNECRPEAAMDAYAKAEDIHPHKISPQLLYRLHINKSILYAGSFDYIRAIDENLRAREYAHQASQSDAEFRSLVNVAILYGNADNLSMQGQYLQQAQSLLDQASPSATIDFYADKAEWMLATGFPSNQIELLLDSIPRLYPSYMDYPPTWNQIARTYTGIGHYEKALDALSHIAPNQYNANTFAVLSEVLDSLRRPKESLEAYKKYVELSDSLDLVLFRQDTRFIEERHEVQIRTLRAKGILSTIGILILCVLTFALIRMRKKSIQQQKLISMYNALKEEYEGLKQISIPAENGANSKAQELLGERMRALAAFFTEEQPYALEHASSRLEALTEDRKELVETIGLLFGVYCPRFVSMLLEHNLTTMEVGFCCLYILGLRTSEIGDVINRAGYYNISSEIRRKLPVGQKKLATWLTEQYNDLCR